MTYDVTVEYLDGTFKLLKQVEANSPADALQKAGYKPDKEDNSCSRAEPRNEYGNPWYPYFRATPA